MMPPQLACHWTRQQLKELQLEALSETRWPPLAKERFSVEKQSSNRKAMLEADDNDHEMWQLAEQAQTLENNRRSP